MMDTGVSRRRLCGLIGTAGLGLAVAPAASLAVPIPAEKPSVVPPSKQDRRLQFFHLHTGERLDTAYQAGGEIDPGALAEVNWFLRDFRNDQQTDIDVALLDILYRLTGQLDTAKPVHIVSAYRSPETNEMLIRNGHGVARKSFHLSGRAIDIRIPGRRLHDVRKAALSLAAGGVGYYPRSNFLHLDTGRVRRW